MRKIVCSTLGTLAVIGANALSIAFAPSAQAHGVRVGISIGLPLPVVVAPAPVYYYPEPVYYAPPPVYYGPPTYYGPPVYYAPRVVYRSSYRHHHHRHWR